MLARRSIIDRMLGALRLDVPTYEEIEAAGFALRTGGTVNAGFLTVIGASA
jgi:hypothetical protein